MSELLPQILLSASAVFLLATLVVASFQDLKDRTVYKVTWYPAAIVCGALAVWFWILAFLSAGSQALPVLLISVFAAIVMALFSAFGLFGKADAKAMILICLTVPVTPFATWIFPSLALSSIINAGVVVLILPVVFLIRNLILRNRAPFWLMCSGMPVEGKEVSKHFGFVSEEISQKDGAIVRRFCKPQSSVFALKNGSKLSIRELRENPDEYGELLELYARCDKVWISYGIPFLIPVTVGYVFALFGVSAVDIVIGLVV